MFRVTDPDARAELVAKGKALFSNHVAPKLNPADRGSFVAIDVITGEYELDPSDLRAVQKLRARLPEPEVWLVRVGSPTTYVIGSRVPE